MKYFRVSISNFTLLIIFNGQLYHYAYVSVYLHETCEKHGDKSCHTTVVSTYTPVTARGAIHPQFECVAGPAVSANLVAHRTSWMQPMYWRIDSSIMAS